MNAARKVDVLIIGAGPAGYVAAIRLGQLGRKVVVVEKDRVGGVCLNRGCIPVKSLLHAAATVRNAAEARRQGIMFEPPRIDLQSLFGWKSRIVDRLVRGIEFLFRSNGVELLPGQARFVDQHTLAVFLPDGREEMVAADAVVIATGSRPAVIPGLEPDGNAVVDSDGLLRVVEIPGRLTVVGAGAIGLEFATIFRRLGSAVTVLELMPQILPGVDPDVAAGLRKVMESEGVKFHTGVKVQGAAGATVTFSGPAGEEAVEADKVLVAVGRRALTEGLDLEKAGAATDERGQVVVDQRSRTAAPHVYAIGDVKSGPQLAHKAMAEGIALAEHLAGARQWKFRAVPSCVYTDPEVATVGLTEAEAAGLGLNVRVSRIPLTAVGRSLTLGRSDGLCKMVVDEASDRILGVAMAAPEADALIAEATVAVELGLTAAQLGRVVHAHPTMSELLFEAAEATHGKAIHVVNR
jgi:dihydrolipoamide dehydrogenase